MPKICLHNHPERGHLLINVFTIRNAEYSRNSLCLMMLTLRHAIEAMRHVTDISNQ